MAARKRCAHIHVAVVSNVFEGAQVPDYAQISLVGGFEYVTGVAAKSLAGEFHKPVPGCGNNVLNRDSGIVNSILAAHQIARHQRTVNPGQYVVMQSIHLAKGGAHLASL